MMAIRLDSTNAYAYGTKGKFALGEHQKAIA